MKKLLLVATLIICSSAFAQDDMQAYLDSLEKADAKKDYVLATFKTFKVINAQTTETTKHKTLDFRIIHRFGNMGVSSNGGGHTLWGFDDSRDIRFSFDYGLSEKLSIGIGRSKQFELLDANFKWRFMTQTTNNKQPVSMALYSTMGFIPQRKDQFYAGVDLNEFTTKSSHRFNYVTQLIVARKQGIVSLEVLPTYVHRNFVKGQMNTNGDFDANGFFACGIAARVKLAKRVSITGDYFYIGSKFRRGTDAFYDPIGIGIEMETGGHIFNINLTNSAGIMENNFLPGTQDNWLKGGYKLGFSISRSFAFNTKH